MSCLPLKIRSLAVSTSSPNLISVPKRSRNGSKRKVSSVFACQEEKDSTTPKVSIESFTTMRKRKPLTLPLSPPPSKRESVMPESPVSTKHPTLSDRSRILNENIPTRKSSATSAPASISTGPTLWPYWTEYTKEKFKKSWSGTGTDFADLESSSYNGSFKKLTANSWFTVKVSNKEETPHASTMQPLHSNSQTTSSPLSRCSWPEIMDVVQRRNEEKEVNHEKVDLQKIKRRKKMTQANQLKNLDLSTVKESSNRCKLIRVYPTPTQKPILNRWFGTYRWTYNQLIAKSKDRNADTKWADYSKKTVRDFALNADSPLLNEYKWVKETPYDIRDGAMTEFLTALKTNLDKRKKNPSFTFDLQFKSKKKHRQESIPILAKHYKGAGLFFPQLFGKTPLGVGREPLPDKLEYDGRLLQNKVGQYFMAIPQAPLHVILPRQDKEPRKPTEVVHQRYFNESNVDLNIASIDPGVRTFATIYDPGSLHNNQGKWIKWGDKDMGRITRLCVYADRLQSQTDTPRKQRECRGTHKGQTSRMKKAFRKIHLKIQHLVKEFHCKCAKWLCENYNLILLPKFKTKDMASTKGSKKRLIRSKTVRQMLTWSHYTFQQRLIHKASQYPFCHVELVTEEYTSKTCPECGYIHKTLGGNKTFKCPQCHYTCDRDAHGSRNIFLKWLTDQHRKILSGSQQC